METLSQILNQYDIPEVASIEMIRESSDNSVYLIGKKNKKVLRVSKRPNLQDVHFEHEALKYLAEHNFPVSSWINTKDGNFFATTKDIAVAVLFDYLEGYHVTVDKNNLPTSKQAYTVGKALAFMAESVRDFKPTSIRQRNIFTELERTLKNEDIFKKEFDGGEQFVNQIKEIINFAKEQKYDPRLIHNDYRAGNVFLKNDSEIKGVIDFDWSCIGPQIKDLALGVLEWSFPDGQTNPNDTIFDTFLDGYNSISTHKYIKGKELYSWIMFAALSDVSTFFCDRLGSVDLKRKISYSYMYQKYLYFAKLNN